MSSYLVDVAQSSTNRRNAVQRLVAAARAAIGCRPRFGTSFLAFGARPETTRLGVDMD